MADSTRAAGELAYIEKFAKTLDHKWKFPGTNFKFGIDPIIGLVPFLGDGVSFLLQGGLVLVMMRHGASGKVAVKMGLNVLLDFVIGSIPVIGWIFDFFYKASYRNLKLLREHYHEDKHQGSGKGLLIGIAIGLLVLFILMVWAIIELIIWLISLAGAN